MKHLTKEQRYEISAYLKCDKTKIFIAKVLGVDRSTIGRELQRNSTKHGKYFPEHAHMLYNEKKERLKRTRTFTKEVEEFVVNKLKKEQWSPEQIVGYCKKNDRAMVSHERIYQLVREDKKTGGVLYTYLRHKLKHRNRPVTKFIPIKNRVSIDERPEVINNKERFGDWEIDTIIGDNQKGAIVTVTERTTNFILMKKLSKGKNAASLAKEVIAMLMPYKSNILSITSDNGTEFAEHEKIAKALDTKIYFAHPYSSWEKGLIEYSNKLIRQYIPKKSNFNDFSNQDISMIQKKINARPRKNLNFCRPFEVFYNLVNSLLHL